MDKITYLKHLEDYKQKHGYSNYDYFNEFGLKLRGYMKYEFEDWEMQCPFLTDLDYKKLLYTDEENIIYYFALAMSKVIELNEVETTRTVEDSFDRSAIEEVINEELDSDELTRRDIESIISGRLEEDLSRREIESIINDRLDAEDLSRRDIEEVINSQLEEETLTRGDIERIIDSRLDAEDLSRRDIEEVINGRLDEDDLTRADIEEVVNHKLDNDLLSRFDIEGIIEGALEEVNQFTTKIVDLGRKVTSYLKSLVLIKTPKFATLYTFDNEKGKIEDKKEYPSDEIKASSGFYVNYEEYLHKMIDMVYNEYPDASLIKFVDSESKEEFSYQQVVESAYLVLKQAGVIVIGDELKNKDLSTYKDFQKYHVEGTVPFGKSTIKKGIYVNKDYLNEIFDCYRIKVFVNKEKQEQNINRK